MTEELKIRIKNCKAVENGLLRLGAKFIEELDATDTYFNRPVGEVLKITESSKGNFLVELRSKDGKFEIVKRERIQDVEKLKRELTEKYGIRSVLKKKRRFFDLKDYKININLIEGVGEFLIVEGKDLTSDIMTKKLQIKDPEFITLPFDRLKINE